MADPAPHPHATRRELLGAAACTGIGALTGAAGIPSRRAPASPAEAEDLLDRGYERIVARTPDANPHRSNHAPMVIEALARLGRPEAIAAWLDDGLAEFEPAPRVAAIDPERWREALSRHERFGDWHDFFARELAGEEYGAVLRRWVPRLAPGLAGAATHGVIRTAHAARALSLRDNPVRRHELATGLAYWAVTYVELPWDGSVAPEKSVAAALARVTPRLPASEPPPGNIVTGLAALDDTPSFRPVAGWIDLGDPLKTLSEMAPAFARLYLANPARRIAFTHAITAPSALRLLVPHLDEETVRVGLRNAWQAAAGLYVVYGDPRLAAPSAATKAEPAAIIGLAVESGGAHAIKLTEACLREEAFSHDPLLLQAACDAASSMSG